METTRQRRDLMGVWITAQELLMKDWIGTMRGHDGAYWIKAWSDTIEVWERSVTQVLDLQVEWGQRWMEGVAVTEGTPEPLRRQIRQGQDMLQRWTDVQKELWKTWFGFMKNLSSAMDPRSVALASQNVGQIQRDGMQRLIDLQTQWAGSWMPGMQEMDQVATDAVARNGEVAPAERVSEEPARTPVPEASGTGAITPSNDVNVQIEEEVVRAHAAEGERPVEPGPSRPWPGLGFPKSSRRDDLIHAIMSAAPTDAAQATRAVDVILGGLAAALAQGEDVRLPGFGSFRVIQTQARVGRNPRTNEPIAIPAGRKVVFRPASDLRKAVTAKSLPS